MSDTKTPQEHTSEHGLQQEHEAPHEPTYTDAEQAFMAALPDDLTELRQIVLEYKKNADETLNDLKRTAAEFHNYRRRVTEEMGMTKERGRFDMLKALYPLFDDIDQGVKNSKNPTPEQMEKGLLLLQQKLRHILQTLSIETVDPTGQRFDPLTSEAITTLALPGIEPDTVIETVGVGYKYKDETLRPARVVVAAEG